MEILRLEETNSTNTWLAEHSEGLSSPCLVYCDCQTSGRGQRGNSWESAPGQNITASLLLRLQDFPACRQFEVSECIALSIVEFLNGFGIEAKIKWPNDIYVGNKKICGILVEHQVMGSNLSRTIAGFGINVNQTEFLSDAPNPVSMKLLTGENYNINELVSLLAEILQKNTLLIDSDTDVHGDFLNKLWRSDDRYYNYYDRKKDEHISCRIVDVARDGMITLETLEGERRKYSFKEIEFIL